MEISLGNLVDQLSITNIKISMLEEVKRSTTASDKEVADATRKVTELNSHRHLLISAIDEQNGKKSGINIKTH